MILLIIISIIIIAQHAGVCVTGLVVLVADSYEPHFITSQVCITPSMDFPLGKG